MLGTNTARHAVETVLPKNSSLVILSSSSRRTVPAFSDRHTVPPKFQTRLHAHGRDRHATRESVMEDWFFANQDGLKLEVKTSKCENTTKPTLLFIHGAGHGAWCWQENFMPYFHDRGYTSHAISLRGQAKSQAPPDAKSGGTLDDHARDISFFIKSILAEAPILIGHSFGGLISQAYVLRDYKSKERVQGMALLAAAPPQGSGAMIKRFFTQRPLHAIMLTWSFMTKSYLSKAGARRLFFSDDLPDAALERYSELLQRNKSKLPAVEVSKIKEVCPLPACDAHTPPVLVLGGDADYSVDLEGFQETADHYGVQPVILPGLAHDLMLDTRWEKVAETLQTWFTTLPCTTDH